MLCALSIVGCQEADQRMTSDPTAVTDEAVTFLIEAAATDFKTHVAPTGATFRNVHPGVMQGEENLTMTLICGEYHIDGATDRWDTFATLRTDGYENWVGGAAGTYCASPDTVLETNNDLAEVLNQQYRLLPMAPMGGGKSGRDRPGLK